MPQKKRGTGKRELIDTGRDKRYVRRDEKGRFTESDDVGRSLSRDVKQPAKRKVPPGSGDVAIGSAEAGSSSPRSSIHHRTLKSSSSDLPAASSNEEKQSA